MDDDVITTQDGNYAAPDVYQENDDRIMPLDVTLKSQFERVFGADFSNVRIHTGLYADKLTRDAGALAVTMGNDVYFANGRYSPETIGGIKLLAHELQHVVQYHNDRSTAYNEDIDALEAEAEKIEGIFDDLLLHEISGPLIDQTAVAQIDQSEAATSAVKGLRKPVDQEVAGLDQFSDKDRSSQYMITLPSSKNASLSAEEFAALKQKVRSDIIDYYKEQVVTLTEDQLDEFVLKFYNFLRT